MSEKSTTRTPLNEKDTATSLQKCAGIVLGPELSQSLLSLLLAQIWIETGEGKNCFNFNVGNITGDFNGDFWPAPWMILDDNSSERYKTLNALALEGKAPSKFRAYPNLDSGIIDYLSLLKRRFPTIIAAASENSSQAMAEAIFSSKYAQLEAGQTPDKVAANLESLANGFLVRGLFKDLPKVWGQEELDRS